MIGCFAACNVIYINSLDMESLTGPEAVAKAVKETLSGVNSPTPPKTTVVHFKVSNQGITLTDNKRKWVDGGQSGTGFEMMSCLPNI